MAELVDALDLKSNVLWTYRFDSDPGYPYLYRSRVEQSGSSSGS